MSCRKLRFRSKLDALLALARLRMEAATVQRRNRETRRSEARAYLCPGCRGWHLTSMGGGS